LFFRQNPKKCGALAVYAAIDDKNYRSDLQEIADVVIMTDSPSKISHAMLRRRGAPIALLRESCLVKKVMTLSNNNFRKYLYMD
jgi:hypothetical protein